jgi:sulfur carrier protein
MITITLNGKPKKIEGSQTVISLLQSLNINPKQVAVAIDGEVVTRDTWPEAVISEGDAVEIVRAVGGG